MKCWYLISDMHVIKVCKSSTISIVCGCLPIDEVRRLSVVIMVV